jgi:ABC-type transport system involved in multi-copper enzyme maturation permease subunit
MSTTHSEWIKFRSVRSTIMGFLFTFVLTIGLGALITVAIRGHWNQSSVTDRLTFDAVSTSLAGTYFASFAVGVIGILFITSEYSSGSIRTTLAAVPNRVRLMLGKLIVLALSMIIVSEIVCFITFLMGQAIYSGVVPTASLGNGAVLRSVLLAGLYLTLLAVLGFAIGIILRQSGACISVFTSILLIIPLIIFFLPQSWQTSVSKYEPSALGRAMMSTSPPSADFGAWTALMVLAIYVIVVLGVGTAMLVRRDA